MSNNSNWKQFPKPEPDAILSLLHRSLQDNRPNKVNMTAGIYADDDLKPFLLHSVDAALNILGQRDNLWFSAEVTPEGDCAFTKRAIQLMLGEDSPKAQQLFHENKVAGVHCQSGGNALYLAFELVKKFRENKTIYLSSPTWPIHNQMAKFHGLNIKTYPYYNAQKNCFDYEAMIATISQIEKESVFLIQPCGQNPTGYDPTKEQWVTIIDLLVQRDVFVIFDTAYYGFATGDLDNDAYAIRLLVERGAKFVITQSYSKNFGLYSARVGFIAAICDSVEQKEQYERHIRLVSLVLLGKPSTVGSEIIKTVITDDKLYDVWNQDLQIMSGRIANMRKLLYEEICKYKPKRDWSFLVEQIGMFAYTGLTSDQVDRLINDYAIYLIHSGRISICGLNKENVPYVAKAFVEITEGVE